MNARDLIADGAVSGANSPASERLRVGHPVSLRGGA
jgi:hypothetical protein